MRRGAMAVVVALVAAACAGGGEEAADSTITIAGQPANDHGLADVSGAGGFVLELGDFYFSPTVLTGTPGQVLTIAARNVGETSHTFTVPEQGINLTAEPGARVSAAVTFPDSGVVAFVCTFHAAEGMVGGLASGGVGGAPVEDGGSIDPYEY
jgi:plastocyanin